MMKTRIALIGTSLILAGFVALAGEKSAQPKQASPEFEKMKSLVGTWKGKADIGEGPIEMTLQYRLIAAGSVLEERIMAGTPNEMVTMYYIQGGKLALTHYCMMGNRPAMLLEASDGKSLKFDLDQECGIDTAKESHMHSMTIRFDNKDKITTSCKAMIDGKAVDEHFTTFKRVKS